MKNYVIINGVNSLTITGLAISKLPSISKPPLRVMTEEINGRDGDLITELGYGAYDKELVIGLYGNYDINEVIGFFNQEGTIVFSNEDDKYYNFKIINQIDYEALIKFRTATINLHCQPFKYPLTETPEEITTEYVEDEGEAITLNDTKIAPLEIDLKGNSSQTGTPTPSSPIPVNVVSGDNEVVVCGKNLLNPNKFNATTYVPSIEAETSTVNVITNEWNGFSMIFNNLNLPSGDYTIWCEVVSGDYTGGNLCFYDLSNAYISTEFNFKISTTHFRTLTATNGINQLKIYSAKCSSDTKIKVWLVKGSLSSMPTYEPYTSQNYPLYLGVENLAVNGNTSKTQSGVTFTINADKSISVNGTATADVYYVLRNDLSFKSGETYTLSGCNGGSLSTYYLYCYNIGEEYNGSKTATLSADFVNRQLGIVIKSGYTANNLTFYPQLERGSKANSYTPYGTTPIELCKIGNYVDFPFKAVNGDKYYDTLTQAQKDLLTYGKWYLHKEVEKRKVLSTDNWSYWTNETQAVFINYTFSNLYNYLGVPYCNYFEGVSAAENNYYAYIKGNNKFCFRYSNGTIDKAYFTKYDTTSLNDFKTWLDGINLYVYYVLATPTNIEITNTTLISQLEDLRGAMSYEGQTNISQVNNDLPFILSVKGIKEGSGEGIINNIGNIYAKPIIALEGTGTIGIYKNGTQYFEVDMSNDSKITIDTEKMEAYHNGVLKNRQVIGDYNKFTIDEGNNNIEITGELTKATITKYTRYL